MGISLNSLSVRVLYVFSMAIECFTWTQIGGSAVFGPLLLPNQCFCLYDFDLFYNVAPVKIKLLFPECAKHYKTNGVRAFMR